MQLLFSLVLLVTVSLSVLANPAIESERAFHRIVNSDECLKKCMKPVQESNTEMLIFKRANLSDYLINLDSICSLISGARECIDGCGIQSNPFALTSINTICSEESRKDVSLLGECLNNAGSRVHNHCSQSCGDYEAMNDQIRITSASIKPEDSTSAAALTRQTNDACSVLKCSSRCEAAGFNVECGVLSNGQQAGDLVRELVERVLKAHRMDLESHNLVEAMAQTTPIECNYLFTPEALFNPLNDMASQQAIKKMMRPSGNLLGAFKRDAVEKVSLTLGQLKMKVMERQLVVLAKQERNLDREYEGFSLERLLQKSPQAYANDLY